MCWESSKLKIKTTKKDIFVWKIVYLYVDNSHNKCYSFFNNFVYKKEIFSNLKNYIIAVGNFNAKIARFYIPRGYEYAENKNGEIISSAIVFDGFID